MTIAGYTWGITAVATSANKQSGFTIIELLIASSVFAVVLLTALAGFMEVGRLFYKGVSTTSTQAVTDQIFKDMTGNFQVAANVSPAQAGNGYTYYCIGDNRYTYNLGYKLDTSVSANHSAPQAGGKGGNYGVLKDVLPGSSACAAPCNDQGTQPCAKGTVKFNNPTELLGDNMRVESFSIEPNPGVSPNFYNVSIIVAYGDDAVLDYTTAGDPSTVYCKGNSVTQQFCAVNKLDTGVYKGGQ